MAIIPPGRDAARRFGHRSSNPALLTAAFFLVVSVAAGGRASAEDAGDIPHSVIAPLASQSLLLDAEALDDRLVVVGERGHVLISTNNGADWRQIVVPTRAMLTGVDFIDDTTGVAVGHDSVILRTVDGGETWERVYWAPDDEAPFFDVWFADSDNGVAIGAYGSHYRTVDGGLTWDFESLADTDWHLHEIARADDGRLYVAAEAGSVFRSDDDGDSWIELPSPYEGSYFGVLPLDGDTVLLFGLRGHLFRSEDAGESWQAIPTGTVAMLNSGIRLSDGTILIVGLGGTVLVSTDEGRSFELYRQVGRRGIQTVTETSDGSLLMVGEFGVRTTDLAELTAEAE